MNLLKKNTESAEELLLQQIKWLSDMSDNQDLTVDDMCKLSHAIAELYEVLTS